MLFHTKVSRSYSFKRPHEDASITLASVDIRRLPDARDAAGFTSISRQAAHRLNRAPDPEAQKTSIATRRRRLLIF
jgi:hypothetical protein